MPAHCESCAYFDNHHTNTSKPASDGGLCRYNPPVSQPTPDARGLWPIVGKADWCGHYANPAKASLHAA